MAALSAPSIRAFFDEPTNTVSYLVSDPATRSAAIIDPVLDYDHAAGKVDIALGRGDSAAPRRQQGLTIEWVLETHAHADHLSGAPYSRPRPARRSASASTSRTCSAFSGRSSTPPTCAPTAAISTGCSPTASSSRSAT